MTACQFASVPLVKSNRNNAEGLSIAGSSTRHESRQAAISPVNINAQIECRNTSDGQEILRRTDLVKWYCETDYRSGVWQL